MTIADRTLDIRPDRQWLGWVRLIVRLPLALLLWGLPLAVGAAFGWADGLLWFVVLLGPCMVACWLLDLALVRLGWRKPD